MAEDDGAQAVGRGAERERVLGVQPAGVRDEGEGIRPVTGYYGAAQRDRVCLPPEAAVWLDPDPPAGAIPRRPAFDVSQQIPDAFGHGGSNDLIVHVDRRAGGRTGRAE